MKYDIEIVRTNTMQVYHHTGEKPTVGTEMSEIIYLLDQIDFAIIVAGWLNIRTDISDIKISREEDLYIFDIIAPGERLHVTVREVEQ